ncbi:MAG: chromosomal replication initiator protein DnaA [Patescibacteria group bacterium]
MQDHKTLWSNALVEIELEVSRANFGTWFKNTKIVKEDDGIIHLGVPNAFVKDWLFKKYHKSILRSLRNLFPEIRAVEYLIIKAEVETENAKANLQPTLVSPQLNLTELYTNREDNLNPKYIFESFIVGPFNELAHAATQAVIKQPGQSYNPLFIYGGTGLGKTHLIQSVGNYIKKNYPGKKAFYITSEQFTVDYVNAMQNNKGNLFKEKYRRYDLLIIDDVQFFSNKERTQEELFHLFNHFHDNGKQIIFSSDKAPKQIPDIEERLRSRFEGGMMVDISKPEYESRLAILRTKSGQLQFNLPPETLEYIAEVIQDNIRELEGCLNTIICQSQLKNRHLTLSEVKTLIKNNIKPKKMASIQDVANIISSFYNITEKNLYEKTRKKEVVKPRQVMMYLLREDFNTSYPYIGQKLGGRDHTTVIHAYEKVKKEVLTDDNLKREIEQIRNLIYQG